MKKIYSLSPSSDPGHDNHEEYPVHVHVLIDVLVEVLISEEVHFLPREGDLQMCDASNKNGLCWQLYSFLRDHLPRQAILAPGHRWFPVALFPDESQVQCVGGLELDPRRRRSNAVRNAKATAVRVRGDRSFERQA